MRNQAKMAFKPGRHCYNLACGSHSLGVEYAHEPTANGQIVFIHGLACSRETFAEVFAREYFPNKSLILPDMLGFGRSDKPNDFSYSMEDQAACLERILAAFPEKDLHVVAHSMGNAVALLLSPTRLGRIQSFACLEGNLIADDCGLLSRGIATTPFKDYARKVFPNQQNEFAGHAQLRFAETTPLALHRSARSLVQWSDSGRLLERFRKLACKKAYFWGEENRDMPVLKQLQGIETIMIPGSGHGMTTDNPAAFYKALAEFIGP